MGTIFDGSVSAPGSGGGNQNRQSIGHISKGSVEIVKTIPGLTREQAHTLLKCIDGQFDYKKYAHGAHTVLGTLVGVHFPQDYAVGGSISYDPEVDSQTVDVVVNLTVKMGHLEMSRTRTLEDLTEIINSCAEQYTHK